MHHREKDRRDHRKFNRGRTTLISSQRFEFRFENFS